MNFVGLYIKVGRGQGDGDIGTRVWVELMPGDTVKAKKPDRKMNPELEKLARKFDDELSDEEEDVFETEFAMHKRDYYVEKMGYEQVTR